MALLRYCGGKVKQAKRLLKYIPEVPPGGTFCEPFVGGGSVALAVAAKYPDVNIILNDLDQGIASFWRFIVESGNAEFTAFTERVLNTVPTAEMYYELQAVTPITLADQAFHTLFFNRCSRAESNGKRILGGKNQRKGGVGSRWKPIDLVDELWEVRWLLWERTTV